MTCDTMKHFFILAVAAFGMLLCSCEQSTFLPDVKEYNVDVSSVTSAPNVIVADSDKGTYDLSIALPFDYYIAVSSRFYYYKEKSNPTSNSRYGTILNAVSVDGNSISYPALDKDNDGFTYTRDLAFVVNSKENFLLKEGDGLPFKWSINIRQYGDKTKYYTKEDVVNFLTNDADCQETDVENNGEQLYILGTVKSVNSMFNYDGFKKEVTQTTGNNETQTLVNYYEPCLWTELYAAKNLQAIDFVVDVDGAEAPVRVQYPASYKRIEKLASELQVGKTVEIAVNKSGIKKSEGEMKRCFYILPSDILVK